MRTKVVYVLISSENDIYLEQLWVSLFSLKHHNPKVYSVVVADKDTASRINDANHCGLRELIDEVKEVEFAKEISCKERSRFLKTSLRKLLIGDFLFLDTDTVITDDLSEIDALKEDVAIVLDLHCRFNAHPYEKSIRRKVKKLFVIDLNPETDYYNSGVMFVRDTVTAHRFFDEWHKNWQSAKDNPQGLQDQQSLVYTINKIGIVAPLSGEYNCQVLGSIEFLSRAKIIHFFNTQWSGAPVSVFFEKSFYRKVRNEGGISKEIGQQILNCKASFVSPSMPIGLEDMKIWRTASFKLLRVLSKHKRIFSLGNKASSLILKFINKNSSIH